MSRPKNSYTNPAFCQQSEFYQSRCKSPNRSVRQSPVGAQAVHLLDTSIRSVQNEPLPPKPVEYQEDDYHEEQEFYEEMILDDSGAVQEKKFVVVHNENRIYEQKPRYEYIPLQDHERQPFNKVMYHEEVDASTGRVHRYATIPSDEETEEVLSKRYALVPVEEIRSGGRYAVITQDDITHRYDYIPHVPSTPTKSTTQVRTPVRVANRVPPNPEATQKLHELLTTPRKKLTTPKSPVSITPTQRAQNLKSAPRAQQKLNYALGSRQVPEKRHTAIVQPMCSSPVYCETTSKNVSRSWNSLQKHPANATLAVAAFMMILCGGVTSGLCIYMISFMGRVYFLDFGILSGFTCFLLGLLGFRSRNVYWLPNRNYLSGYFVLSIFSLLTCAGLLILLFMQPRPGSPLNDMTSGAVCGISALSLLLASSGVVASYCCKVPPPDNRVQHGAPGFNI